MNEEMKNTPLKIDENIWDLIDHKWQYAAMDENGNIFLYLKEPVIEKNYWIILMGEDGEERKLSDFVLLNEIFNIDTTGVIWNKSLTKRPNKKGYLNMSKDFKFVQYKNYILEVPKDTLFIKTVDDEFIAQSIDKKYSSDLVKLICTNKKGLVYKTYNIQSYIDEKEDSQYFRIINFLGYYLPVPEWARYIATNAYGEIWVYRDVHYFSKSANEWLPVYGTKIQLIGILETPVEDPKGSLKEICDEDYKDEEITLEELSETAEYNKLDKQLEVKIYKKLNELLLNEDFDINDSNNDYSKLARKLIKDKIKELIEE